MKKTIIFELLHMFVLGLLIYFSVVYWQVFANYIEYNIVNSPYPSDVKAFYQVLTYVIILTLGCIAEITAMILIAIKDLPVFKPIVDKYNAHKQARLVAQAEKSEQQKQARIEKLQAELDELKKD